MNLTIYTDGLCDPNPGTGTWAWIAFDEVGEVAQASDVITGRTTNNIAEYYGLGFALRYLSELVFEKESSVLLCLDSQLVLNQVTGEWECHHPSLKKLRDRCRELVSALPVEWKWVPSADNKADGLTRAAYQKATGREAKAWSKRKIA